MSTKQRLSAAEKRLKRAAGERSQRGIKTVYRLDDGRFCNRLPDFRYDERGLSTGNFPPAECEGVEFYTQEALDEWNADGWLVIAIHYVDDWQEPGGLWEPGMDSENQ